MDLIRSSLEEIIMSTLVDIKTNQNRDIQQRGIVYYKISTKTEEI